MRGQPEDGPRIIGDRITIKFLALRIVSNDTSSGTVIGEPNVIPWSTATISGAFSVLNAGNGNPGIYLGIEIKPPNHASLPFRDPGIPVESIAMSWARIHAAEKLECNIFRGCAFE